MKQLLLLSAIIAFWGMQVHAQQDYSYDVPDGSESNIPDVLDDIGGEPSSLIKTGTGILNLSGANTYTGGTTISEGTLTVTGMLGSGNYDGAIANSGMLIFNQSADQMLSGEIYGNGTLAKYGTGALIIQPAENHTITNHFKFGGRNTATGEALDPNASLTFDIATDKTLTISDTKNTETNSYTGSGGAINVNVHGTDALRFTGGGRLVLSNNLASYGGAIGAFFNSPGLNSAIDFTDLESAVFSGNISDKSGDGGLGGAIYFLATASSSLTFGNGTTFTNNISGNSRTGLGGAIYIKGTSASSISMGVGTLFASNRAGGDTWGGEGGAIWASHDIALSGNTLFEGNYVSSYDHGTLGSLGGAIYFNGNGTTNTATLDTGTDAAPIAFSGNRIDALLAEDSGVWSIVPDTGTPNAMYLRRRTALNLKGDGNIYFDDPISSGTDGENSLVKKGNGFVQFVGNNRLNTTNYANTNSVDIKEGTFRVVNDASTESFDASGAGTFNVASGATLAGQGMIKATDGFTISGIVSPDADRLEIPTFVRQGDTANGATDSDYNFFNDDKATTVATNKNIGTLSLNGDVEFNNATLAVDIASASSCDKIAVAGTVQFSGLNTVYAAPADNGTYDILTATSDMTLGATDFSPVAGIGMDGYSYTRGGSSVHLKDGDAKTLQLTLDNTQNLTLIWTGAESSTWASTGLSHANWTDGIAGGETYFKDGDVVTFDSNYATENDVAVDTGGVTMNGMTVVSGDWSFSDGAIAGTGGLTMSSPGTLTLSGYNTYTGGTTITNGTLQIGNGGTTGAVAGNITNNAALAFNRSDNVTYSGIISGTGSVEQKGNGTLTLSGVNTYTGTTTIASGATLALGHQNALQNSGLVLNGVLTVNQASTVPSLSANGATINFGNLNNILTVTGDASFANTAVNIDVNGASGTYTLIDYGSVTGESTITVSAENLGANRGGPFFDTANTALKYQVIAGNTNLIWNGMAATADWNTTDSNTNWNTGNVDAYFKDGDAVTFEESDAKNVTVSASGVYVAEMTLSANDYTFSGGTISGTGTLVINENVTLNNTLSGFAGVAIAANKTMTVNTSAGDWDLSSPISGEGNFEKTGDGTLTLSANSTSFAGNFIQSDGNVHLTGSLDGAFIQHSGTFTSEDGVSLADANFKGTVEPTGTLSLASANFDGATINFGDLSSANAIVVSGNADFIDATINLDMTNASVGTYTLMSYGTTSSSVNDITLNSSGLSSNLTSTLSEEGNALVLSVEEKGITGLTNSRNALDVYPNPVERGQAVNIELPFGKPVNAWLLVSDINGAQLHKQPVSAENFEVIMPMTPGLYIIHIYSEDFNERIKIVVK